MQACVLPQESTSRVWHWQSSGGHFSGELAELCLKCVESFECADRVSHHEVPERDAELSRDGDGRFVSSAPCCYCQSPTSAADYLLPGASCLIG